MSELERIVKELADIDQRLEAMSADDRQERVDLEDRRHELRARAAEVRKEMESGEDAAEEARRLVRSTPPR